MDASQEVLWRKPPTPESALNAAVHVFDNLDALSRTLAGVVVATINDAVRASGRCSIALSGGNTPQPLHRLLATDLRNEVPWGQVHVFWGDDRYVPHDDERSNYRMARETLLDHVPCPAGNVHPMPTHFADPADAAAAYQATLRGWFIDEPRFDLVLLGIGTDGHTASLFPGTPALEERESWVASVTAPAEPPVRLTLTFPVLNRAAHTHFLVAGSDKAQVVRRVLTRTESPAILPAAGVEPMNGTIAWWLDKDAAGDVR